MKYREIDQRGFSPEMQVMVKCNCGTGYDHYLVVEYHTDDFDMDVKYKFMSVTLALPPEGLWKRLKSGIAYILGLDNCWFYDIGITEKDIKKIEEVFEGYKSLELMESDEVN